MAEIKLTKSELKVQQQKLLQLERYLPTLQLKKALLQAEVVSARMLKEALQREWQAVYDELLAVSPLIRLEPSYPFEQFFSISNIEKSSENIAGAELPILTEVTFKEPKVNIFDTPPWIDSVVALLKNAKTKKCALDIAKERLSILEHELTEVSIRVNLFEKILIPRCKEYIKKIKIFLGDLLLSAVSQAKVAKAKILERNTDYAH